MSEYGWFCIKGIGYLALIAFAVYMTESAVPLWALVFMPSWVKDEDKDKK